MSKHRESHSSNVKRGTGDYYGTGVKQKVGKLRATSITPNTRLSSKKKGKTQVV